MVLAERILVLLPVCIIIVIVVVIIIINHSITTLTMESIHKVTYVLSQVIADFEANLPVREQHGGSGKMNTGKTASHNSIIICPSFKYIKGKVSGMYKKLGKN